MSRIVTMAILAFHECMTNVNRYVTHHLFITQKPHIMSITLNCIMSHCHYVILNLIVTQDQIMWHCITPCHIKSCYVTKHHIMSLCVTLCHTAWQYVTLYHYAILNHITSQNILISHTTSHHALCYITTWYCLKLFNIMSHFLAFTANYVQFLILSHLQQTCLNGSDNSHIYVSVY